MQFRSMNVVERKDLGSSASRSLRKAGLIPCVIYGKGKSIHGYLNGHNLTTELDTGKFGSQVYEIKLGKEELLVVVRELQRDPVFDLPMHVDFQIVPAGKKAHVRVALKFINREKSRILKLGGTLSITTSHLDLYCPLDSIPEAINVDLSKYQTASSIQVSDLTLPVDAEMVNRKALLIGSIIPGKKKAVEAVLAKEKTT